MLRQTGKKGNEQKGNSWPWQGFYEIKKGRNYQKLGVSGVSRIGKRKEYRYSTGHHPIYYYLLVYQLTAAEVT